VIDVPTVETERLVLRAFRQDDLDAFAAANLDPDVVRYVGAGTPASRADSWRSMASALGHWELRGYGLWAAEERATGAFVGRMGLYNPEGWPGLEAGWMLAPSARGRGFATEGGRASLRHAFGEVGADRVISLIQPANRASVAVAERLGGRYDGMIDLSGTQVAVYAYDRDRWRP
jgi:RimJ/RimL family protein N-acetyltransferase